MPPTQNFAILKALEIGTSKNIVIAIDGPAASGKSTTAALVARRLGYLHLDTGAMYRAMTLRMLREGVPLGNEQEVALIAETTDIVLSRTENGNRVLLQGQDVTEAIRTPEVTRSVSTVSSYPAVRAVLVRQQRKLAEKGGVVLEGRDIGTVVLPDADLKIFMVADVTERARRRKQDLRHSGVEAEEEAIAKELLERDRKDSSRETSPLRQAADAIVLDTSNLTIEEQVEVIVGKAQEILRNRI